MESDLARVVIVGTSCSGKTTLASQLATRLDTRLIELDSLYWGPNWTPADKGEFRRRVDEQTSKTHWICDGNYSMVRDIVWSRATAIVWLNYSLPVVFGRALRRTWGRCFNQEALYAGNRESFRKSFFSSDSILLWVLKTHRNYQREYRKYMNESGYRYPRWVEMRRVADAKRFLDRIGGCCQGRPPTTGGRQI